MSTKYLFRHNLSPFWLNLQSHPHLRRAESIAALGAALFVLHSSSLFLTAVGDEAEDEEQVDEVKLLSMFVSDVFLGTTNLWWWWFACGGGSCCLCCWFNPAGGLPSSLIGRFRFALWLFNDFRKVLTHF